MALRVLASRNESWIRMHVGGLWLAIGIGTMHYVGMEAMRMEGVLRYDFVRFALSIVIAYALATTALYARRLDSEGDPRLLRKLLSP